MDTVDNRKPMELMEDGGDVVVGAGTGEKSGGGVLDVLKFIEGGGWEAVEKAVAVVQSGGDEGVCEGFSSRGSEEGTESGDVFQVKKGGAGKLGDMVVEGEAGVEVDSEVADK